MMEESYGKNKSPRRKETVEREEEDAEPNQKRKRIPEIRFAYVSSVGWLPLVENDERLEQVGRHLARTYRGEFSVSTGFDASFIRRLTYYGFLPMSLYSTAGNILTPKMHQRRCVLCFNALHIPKKVKKQCKLYYMTTNQCFRAVVDLCNQQHGEHSWLCKELVDSFLEIYNSSRKEEIGRVPERAKDEISCRMHSIELWSKNGDLVAGEIGYTVGRCYTSLSGFRTEDSSGTIQCVATARFLEEAGFKFWDLGMALPYKISLGASTWTREKFLSELSSARGDLSRSFKLDKTNARDIIFPTSSQP
ncbi:hypothetical protein NDN08_001391 [Rhodosorus marinus]|uniref:Leucyl/phenylalanyl-tRNA--protein transferase n=1 Tax=Rhodosorus marinus TaxID=101924 RepID=A0AAV8UUE2_9RHOD|nr:hypothetical protein NDN08_001391 [Rhodosorus marinus]